MFDRTMSLGLCRFWIASVFAFTCLFVSADLSAQTNAPSDRQAKVVEQNRDRLQLNRTGMGVLLGWAGLNLAVGTWGAFSAEGRWKYVHQMNAGWNVVNAGIATAGLVGALSTDPASLGMAETIREGYSIEKILLFNAGLDIGYVAGGAFLNERGLRTDSDRLVGYGRSIMVQGAFLFAFDLVLYWLHNRNTNQFLESLAF
jgi:hypothetical protein